MRGVVLPHFLAEHALSATTGAAIFSATALGYCAGSLSFGILSQRFGLKRIHLTGTILTGLAFLLFLAASHPALLYGAMVLVGLGTGYIDLPVCVPVSVLYGERQGGVLNQLHGVFGVGALVGPLVAAGLLALGADWRVPMVLVAGLLTLWGVLYAVLPQVALPAPAGGQGARGGMGHLLRDPLVWAATLSLAASVVIEVGGGLWLPSYLQAGKALSEGESALMTTLFFAGFTVARLGGGWMVGRIGPSLSVVALALVGAVGLVAVIALPANWAWLTTLAGAGVGMVFPTSMALVATRYPELVNQAYSLMYASGALFMLVVSPLMGGIGEWAGLEVAMRVPLGFYAVIAVLMTYYGWTTRRDRHQMPAAG